MQTIVGYLYFFIVVFFAISPQIVAARPLKILFMLHSFPTLSATFVMGQITGLIDRGHDIYIFAYTKSNQQKVHADIEKYGLLKRTYFNYLPSDLLAYDILYCQFFSLAKRLLPVIEKLKKQFSQHPKFVVCCRGSDGIENVSASDAKHRRLFGITDLFLPVCEHFKKYLLKAGCEPRKIKIHHSAIDLTKFCYEERSFLRPGREINLLSIGRLAESKGFKYAIHAFAQLERKLPQLRYAIIGEGSQRKKLEQLIAQYGLEKKITLLGSCSHDAIISLLDKADLFIHPAITSSSGIEEGIPNVIMEAMAMGLPVIATSHGGIAEIIQDGITGFLVPEKNSNELAGKIAFIAENYQSCKKISYAGRKHIEEQHNIINENRRLEALLSIT